MKSFWSRMNLKSDLKVDILPGCAARRLVSISNGGFAAYAYGNEENDVH